MISRARRSSLLCWGASIGLFFGCSDNDEPPAAASDHGAECEAVGELCHEIVSAAGQECHEQAHSGACAFASCVKVCVPGAEAAGADPHCAALGELCHAVEDQSEELRACHELGHVNDAASCAASFADCAARCIAAREAAGSPSEGGAGGNAAGPDHAAGEGGGSGQHR